MKLDTRNLEHLNILQKAVKTKKSISAVTDQDYTVRITFNKNAPEELDSWLTADEMFDVTGLNGQAMLTEFDYVIIS